MGFLSTIYLWLIPLASLPILIHLFYNRQYNLLEFSTIKFLKDLEVDSMKRVQLIELLLLIIRTLIILALILMISRPILKSNSFESYFKSTESIDCIIALDDSFSMSRSDNPRYLKDIYGDLVKDIIETLPEKSHISILKLSSKKIIFDGFKNEYNSNSLKGKIGYGNINFRDIVNLISNQNKKNNNELHILSDLQEYSFSTLSSNSLEGWNVFIHEVNHIADNLSILSVDISDNIIVLNKEIQINATIQNNGTVNAKNALLVLNIDGLNVGQQQIDMSPGETSVFSFFTVLNSSGEHAATIELSYDNLDADNVHLFELNIPDNINVGLLGDSDDDLLFIKNSLKAFGQAYKNISIRFPNEMLVNENLLIENDASFVFGYNYITDKNLESSISDALKKGSNIFIFPSTEDKIKNINTDFFDFISFDYSKLKLNSGTIQLTSENLINKNLRSILSGPKNTSDYRYMNLYKFFTFSDDKKSNILIDGMSIWNTYPIYNGNVNILGLIPRLEWTDFPIKASFLSWINYCITQSLSASNSIYQIGEEYGNINSEYTIISPDSKRYKYTQGDKDLFKFKKRGIYTIEKEQLTQKLIVNPSFDEINFFKIKNEKLKELFENPYIITKSSKIGEEISKARVGVELWKYFLYLSIFLIIIEMVISNQFFRRD